jgi:hypothetical protein
MYNSDIPPRAELPSTAQLLRSTAAAAVAATLILVLVVLPAEFAIDPTGVGGMIGLTQMGEIKMQLVAETASESAVTAPASSTSTEGPSIDPATGIRSDTVSFDLVPGQFIEVKMQMLQGAVAAYTWEVQGGTVTVDMHADGAGGQSVSYAQMRDASGDQGELVAAFDGSHGWYWRYCAISLKDRLLHGLIESRDAAVLHKSETPSLCSKRAR